ncbi:MAG: hypothetical protein ACTTKL_00985 [Treponema sp.]
MFGVIIGAIGSIIAAATTIGKALAIAGLAIQGLKALGSAFVALGKALGIIKPETKPEELGDKAIQAEEAGIKPENFDSYDKYVKAVEGFKVDPEKSKLIPEEEKLQKGITLTSALAAEKYPDFPMEAFAKYVIANPQYFTEARMTEFGKLISGSLDTAKTVFGYMNGTEHNDKKLAQAETALKGIEKAINPNISDSDALTNALKSRK